MRTWWKRLVGATALLLGVASVASAAATWQVVADTDCTGLNAATGLSATAVVGCCRTSAAGGGNYCSYKMTGGREYIRTVTLVTTTGSTYTGPGGDALVAAQMAKIGLQNVVAATCSGTTGAAASGGQDVNWLTTAAVSGYAYGAKLQLFNSGTGLTATGIANAGELANATAIGNLATTCLLIGY